MGFPGKVTMSRGLTHPTWRERKEEAATWPVPPSAGLAPLLRFRRRRAWNDVMGELGSSGWGAFAERVCAPEGVLMPRV